MADVGIKFVAEGNAEFKKSLNDINQNLKVLGSELKATASEYDRNDKSAENLTAQNKVLSKEIEEQKKRVNLLESAVKESSETTGKDSKVTADYVIELNKAKTALNKMERSLSDNEKAMNDLGDETEKTGDEMDEAGSRAVSFGSLLKANLASNVILSGIRAIGSAIKGLGETALGYNAQMEEYTTNFTVMLGDSEEAAKKVTELKEFAASTPFSMGDLADATQTLLAFNITSDKSTGVLKKLGDISLGNADKLNSLTRAYGQMSSANKVSLEKVQIMIEAGYNPLLNIQERTGESMDELYKRISAGKVSFGELEQAITDATSTGGQFCGGMEQASQTMNGLMSTLKDNATALVGEVFSPISEGLTGEILPSAIEAVQELTDAYREKGVEGMIESASDMVGNFLEELGANSENIAGKAIDLAITLINSFFSPENIYKATTSAVDMIFGLTKSLSDAVGSEEGTSYIDAAAEAFVSALFSSIGRHFKENWNIFTAGVDDEYGISYTWNAATGKTVNGSHATGLNYVPFDGYVAELHRGEMVVPANFADSLRKATAVKQQGGVSTSELRSITSTAVNAMIAGGGTAQQSLRVEIPLTINGKEFARAILKDLRDVSSANPEVVSEF